MLATVESVTIVGLEALPVSVEVDVAAGLPLFSIVGLPDAAVQEARERVRAAVRNSGFEVPPRRIVVNLAPGDRRKQGPALDLPIALAILVATAQLPQPAVRGHLAIGELALDGRLRAVPGVLAAARAAARLGGRGLLVPEANAAEGAAIGEVPIYGLPTLRAAVEHLTGRRPVGAAASAVPAAPAESPTSLDLADVRGQPVARRALEIAAAGELNLLLVGPPGVGKTMLARRLPTILPPLSRKEAVEVTTIYSVTGRLPPGTGLMWERPFRAPHHSASAAAIVGGGSGPRPGEITLAHSGVLFLDELPEFRADVLEVLRQPMEDGAVVIVRTNGAVRFPARFVLVAAMNPCPCGYRGDPRRECVCTPTQLQHYRARVSGPLLDRIDLHVEVPRPPSEDLLHGHVGESSRGVRARVIVARQRAVDRAVAGRPDRLWEPIDEDAIAFLRGAADRFSLGGRAVERVLRVGRAIADLDASERVRVSHLAEALQYRVLDRAPALTP